MNYNGPSQLKHTLVNADRFDVHLNKYCPCLSKALSAPASVLPVWTNTDVAASRRQP